MFYSDYYIFFILLLQSERGAYWLCQCSCVIGGELNLLTYTVSKISFLGLLNNHDL